ncbi:MAG: T9SS type A sorting domain-containing protein [Flavobacteriales bacterium]|nr:T9SS type A sorting domain-containing protein [Flavobacteriales bacterium]
MGPNLKAFLLGLTLSASLTPVSAQTLVGSVTGWPRATYLLGNAGPKLILESATTVDILNLDLTPYLSFTLPAAPAGYSIQTRPRFVTEDLFDTDPSTIEYLLEFVPDTGSLHGFAIYRTNGTLLFQAFTGDFGFSNGEDQRDGSDPFIFNTPSGTYMKVMTISGSVVTSTFYLLPGHLPCVDCEGHTSQGEFSAAVTELAPPAGRITVFPNPASERTAVSIDLPDGIDAGELVIYDVQGKEVVRIPVDRSTKLVHVDTSVVGAGTYFHQLITGQGVVRGPKMIVVH